MSWNTTSKDCRRGAQAGGGVEEFPHQNFGKSMALYEEILAKEGSYLFDLSCFNLEKVQNVDPSGEGGLFLSLN